MSWRRVCRDLPEGRPILISYGELSVVALAFRADYYYPEMTFMDARTFEILPTPSHWMPVPESPQREASVGRKPSASRSGRRHQG